MGSKVDFGRLTKKAGAKFSPGCRQGAFIHNSSKIAPFIGNPK
jgi:hypothetical protein